MNPRSSLKLLTVLTVTTGLTSFAGVKYWDNPAFKAFDVGDYVKDGLVINYDGIRNVGADAEHSTTSDTWVNLGSLGSDYDMTKKGSPTSSYWTDNGFSFDSKTWFVTTNKLSHGSKYEIEALVDAEHANQADIGYVLFMSTAFPRASDGGWRYGSIGIRKKGTTFAQTIDGTAYNGTLCLNTDRDSSNGAGTAKRPVLLDETFKYLTAIANETYASIFTGLDEPADVPGRSGLASGRTALVSASLYLYLGGHNVNGGGETSTGEGLTGTICNLRYYSAPLSREQRAWNRVVDEARFFGRSADIPVTNVVVATRVAGVYGDQPCGSYALDEDGYTFTAPVQRTVKGCRYVLNGYTIEAWNGSGWGEATAYTGNSYDATASSKVRLTWKYEHPVGEGKIVVYDESNYVTNGLELFLDGICNAGSGAPHDSSATTWVNLGTSGATGNGTLTKGADGDQGHWTEDGYSFAGLSKFISSLTYTKTYTLQILTDMIQNDQYDPSKTTIYLSSGSQARFALATYNQYVYLRTQNNGNDSNLRFTLDKSKPIGYITAMQENDEKWAAVFQGTQTPSPRNYDGDMDDLSLSAIAIGGWGGGTGQYMKGTIKSFRYYPDKILTDAELEQNRKVDEYRFFGRYVVTNVLVQSTYSYLEGYDKCGAYEVDDSYTFVAPATNTAPNGITYACDGYIVEFQDGIGWTNATAYAGNAYRYSTSAGTVRLTWKWKATHGLRTAANYGFDDLSPAGLALHYDGLLNQGIGVDRSTTSTTWINLGSRPGMDLTRKNADGFSPSWGEKGHVFPGRSMFESSASVPWPTTFSAQVLVDAKFSENTHVSGNYIAAQTWKWFGMQIDGPRNVGRFNAQGQEDYSKRANYAANGGIDYMTAIHDAKSKTAVVFPGTQASTGGSVTDGYMHFDTFNGVENNKFRLGGWGGGTDAQCLVGTIYTFRYYDRVLTEEELVRNRNVDSVRYFNALAVTNVFVVAGGEGAVQTETGAYKVEGSWTFTATKTVNRKGAVVDVARYSVEELVNGEWKNKEYGNGQSYTYTEGTDPATVRLKWLGLPVGATVILR